MRYRDQSGGAAMVLSSVLLVIALIAALGFGYWAFTGRQDYKNNYDKKAAVAVAKGQSEQSAKDTAAFEEKEKSPNKTFKGPATYGSLTFNYPKTWSGYIDESSSSDPLKTLFYPDLVPAPTPINNVTPQYALRADLVDQNYNQVMQSFGSYIQQGTLKAVAYVPPSMAKVSNVQTGTKLDGAIAQNVQGSMVVIKVRDKTLKIYTESPKFLNDFNNTVLSSLTFVP